MHFDLWIVLAFAGCAAALALWRRRAATPEEAAARAGAGAGEASTEGTDGEPARTRALATAAATLLATSIAVFELVPRQLGLPSRAGLDERLGPASCLAAVLCALVFLVRRGARSGPPAGAARPQGESSRMTAPPPDDAGGVR